MLVLNWMDKRTKIIVTIGPATGDEKTLRTLIKSGADVMRLNTKHNTLDWHKNTVDKIKKASHQVDKKVGIIIDLPEPCLKNHLRQFIESMADTVDYLALSFVREKGDVLNVRETLKSINDKIGLISKIENPAGLKNIDQIIEVSDGVMIARGDLAVEAGFEKLPGIQKKLILKCRRKGKPVVVATEMLESMIKNKTPTRAEVSDVANAVYDGADCLMLSGETAVGQYPVQAVEMMAKVISSVEREGANIPSLFKDERFPLNDESIVRLADKMTDFIKREDQPAGYLVFTKSGRTAFSLSVFRPNLPIFAFTDNPTVMDKLLLGYGVDSFQIEFDEQKKVMETIDQAIAILKEKNVVKDKDKLIIVSGDNIGVKGSTNNIRITQI